MKVDGKHCGLAIIDADLPGMSGFELVNELFERNHGIEIVIMEDARTPALKPKEYFGDVEVIPRKPWVSHTLSKPFHSEALLEALREIGIHPPPRD
jgi:CheY-like chemotaxis protein